MEKARGFTLIEILVVIAMVAILISLAVPSFKTMIQSNVMSSNVNSFLTDMRYARSEAIRRGGGVVMCRSNAPETTQACNGNIGASNGWLTGWIIFHDLNNDGTKDAGEPVLRVQGPITSMDSIIEPTSPSYKFRFNATGRLPGTTTTINFGSSDFPGTVQRVVCVSVGGRARVAGDGYSSCS